MFATPSRWTRIALTFLLFASPALGADTRAVLRGIGYTDAEIARLAATGATGGLDPEEVAS